MRKGFIVLFSLGFIYSGCDTANSTKNRGAIVFGDSSLIVTENDPKFLSNNVPDLIPQKPAVDAATIAATPVPKADTVAVAVQNPVKPQAAKPITGNGLSVPFKGLNIFIQDVKGRSAKNIDWNKVKSASYTLEEGELNNKSLVISEGEVTKIMQRQQTVVMLELPGGKPLRLSGLPASTSEWQTLKGKNGRYPITNGSLAYKNKFSPNALKNAVQKLARSNRLSRKEEEQLLKSVRNVKVASQKPLSIALQSVVWKISSKETSGKQAEHELRIDINR